jgi:hypothetical protein
LVVIADATAVVLEIAVLVNGQFCPETEDIHQEDADLDALPSGLEARDYHPANPLAEKVPQPESFMSCGRRLPTGYIVHGLSISGRRAEAML